MLTGVKLKNFKCFDKIEVPDLRDITIITGTNNVGKSTVMQAVAFLKESILRDKFAWESLRLKNFKETVYKHETKRKIGISCTFKLREEEKQRIKKYVKKNLEYIKLEITLNKDDELEQETISSDGIEIIVFKNERGRVSFTLKKSELVGIKEDYPLMFGSYSTRHPLSWKLGSVKQREDPKYQFCQNLKDILLNKFKDIYYISDRRGISNWFASLSEEPKNVGFVGENATAKLHYIYSDRNEIFYGIEKWVKKIDPEIQMLKSPLKNGKATIEIKTLLTDVNIMTSGYGLNTLFPIIIQSLISPSGSIILIEEPEIHLHKGAQKIIFDMFLELLEEDKQIIFTTHSYDMLLPWYEKAKDSEDIENKSISWNLKRENSSREAEEIKPIHHFNRWKEQLKNLA